MTSQIGNIVVIDNQEDIRFIISKKLSLIYPGSEIVSVPFSDSIPDIVRRHNPDLIISDVPPSHRNGFWLHDFLLKNHPHISLVLFVSDTCLLRNIPMQDGTLRASILKYDFQGLYKAVKEVGYAHCSPVPY